MITIIKNIFIYISIFIFIFIPTIDASNENIDPFLKQYQAHNKQVDKINHSFLTEIDNEVYFFPNDLNIVSLGDSLTQGVGDESDNEGYVGLLEADLDNNLIIENYGIAGYRSDQLLELLDDPNVVASLTKADIVLITIGANDMLKVFKRDFSNLKTQAFLTELKQFENRLKDIFTTIHQANANSNIYLIGFYDPFSTYFPEIDELSYIYNEWTDKSKIVADSFDYTHFIPTNELFKEDIKPFLADDNFHPNHAGYQKISSQIINYIKLGTGDAYERD